jgi:hypothetical protein
VGKDRMPKDKGWAQQTQSTRRLGLINDARLSREHGRDSHAWHDARASIPASNQRHPSVVDFSRPDDISELNAHIEHLPEDKKNSQPADSQIDYRNVDTQLTNIYAQWNVNDFINGEDISSLLNALHHNQNNEYTDTDLDAVNLLYAK